MFHTENALGGKFMRKLIIKIAAVAVAAALAMTVSAFSASAEFDVSKEIKSVILIEPETQTVLYERNADEQLAPASVTKTMTALLVMEAIDSGKLSYDSMLTVSARASGMGGSQIFLEVGETICVRELLEGMMVASGNDAAVAFAEALGGSEENFVDMMNAKAAELGCTNTHFVNCHGLDIEGHYTSARDIATISAELIKHEKILEFSSIWTGSIRGGKTSLANTNKLVRFYEGCDGLKTGSTSIAKSCITATAKRGGMRLIAVVMGAPSSDVRNAAVRQMFDYGFAIDELLKIPSDELEKVSVTGGVKTSVRVAAKGASFIAQRGTSAEIVYETELPEHLAAPVRRMQVVGRVRAVHDGKELFSSDVLSLEEVKRISTAQLFARILKAMCGR